MADFNSIDCIGQRFFYLDFSGNPINSGEYWVAMNDPNNLDGTQRTCVETTSNVDQPGSGWFATQQYTNCYDCISNNNGLIQFENCFDVQLSSIFVDVSAFTESQYLEVYSIYTGGTGEVLSLEFMMNGTLQNGCYIPKQLVTLSTAEYQQISLQLQFSNQQIVNTLTYTAQTNCETCLTATSFVYIVENCITEEFDYVYLPYNFPTNNLISYTDGINEFCGIVQELSNQYVATYTFVTDYGECNFVLCCDVCLENANKRVLIQNCSDEGDQIVVWASQLFGVGQASNLEINGGCYEIIGETLDPVTQSGFLDFEPHAGCTSCQTCNGVNYEYFTCDDVFVGYLQTNQIPPFGYEFLNPFDGLVYKIGNQTSTAYDIYISTLDPVSCLGVLPGYKVWLARECYTNTIGPVYTDGLKQLGDFVQIMYGDNDFLCVELIEAVDPTSLRGIYNTKRDGGGNTITYNDCEECIGNRTIGVRTVNCDTQELQIVDIPYSAYTQLLTPDFESSIFSCFVDSNNFCRTVVELCPQPLSNNVVTPVDEYFSCPTCRAFNPIPEPDPARSANTEYFECITCCPCDGTSGTTTPVAPPHPVWTDGYGTPVTQLNMVALGGMKGLNS